uniref:Uncharacterized protein n=1 Tax=Medicago truncatula TaxID=3880 RepID=I3SN86_MEDTR|nr:unknown [Medicago truncatula]
MPPKNISNNKILTFNNPITNNSLDLLLFYKDSNPSTFTLTNRIDPNKNNLNNINNFKRTKMKSMFLNLLDLLLFYKDSNPLTFIVTYLHNPSLQSSHPTTVTTFSLMKLINNTWKLRKQRRNVRKMMFWDI